VDGSNQADNFADSGGLATCEHCTQHLSKAERGQKASNNGRRCCEAWRR